MANSKKVFTGEKSLTLTGSVWDTTMAGVTSRENTLLSLINKQVTYENLVVLPYKEWQSLTRDINS